MELRNKAKLFWWIYTISDIVVQIFGAIVLLTTAQVAAKDNTLLTPYDIVSKIQIVIFLLYMLYRIVVLYKVEKRMVPMVMGIILVLAFVLNNIPSIGGSISLISAVVNALTFVLWIYDIKLIFLDEKDKSSEAAEN
ncbi:MAG: hypothetical protein ACLVFG_10150 [Lachnospiraceae bacterium]